MTVLHWLNVGTSWYLTPTTALGVRVAFSLRQLPGLEDDGNRALFTTLRSAF